MSLHSFLHKNQVICDKCFLKFKPKFRRFIVDGIKGLSLYDYDDTIQSLLYQFKGCFDIELAHTFLDHYYPELRHYYHGYIMVPAPSYYLDDLKREFNHVEEIFLPLKLPILKIITKTDKYKQSDQKKSNRKDIAKHLKMSNIEMIKNKKILIVDDVFTTGSTISAMIQLIKTGKPKNIRVLVIAKTIFDKNLIDTNAKSIEQT